MQDTDSDQDDLHLPLSALMKKPTRKRKIKAVTSKAKQKAKPTAKKAKVVKSDRAKKPKVMKMEVDAAPVKVKELSHTKKLDLAMQAYKWWEHESNLKENEEDFKWATLEHNGLMFPPPFEPKLDELEVNLYYNGKVIKIEQEAEELAWLYAAIPLDGQQLGIPKVAKVFNKNFFQDFRKTLSPSNKSIIKDFKLLDFTEMRNILQKQKEEKKEKTKEEKELIKQQKEKEKVKFSFAFVDNYIQRVGNVMVEPPGLFRGRGEHPKTGTYKTRVFPEQITLNIGEDDMVPPCPVPGHSWGTIAHKREVTWLAFWRENVLNNFKYVWLAASSGFKGKADRDKYEKARRLKNCIDKIRKDYEKNLTSDILRSRQIATAMWVIDRLALRVGNEKEEDEADTVGCCSLRVEHVLLKDGIMTLDFLGKDSMRHFQEYALEEKYGEVGVKIMTNLQKFCIDKKPTDELFDKLEVTRLNDHLKSLMPGLSAKVFRTFNASSTLQKCLENLPEDMPVQEKMLKYNAANREVAILCNHQRSVSKAAETSLKNMDESVKQLEKQVRKLRQYLKQRKNKEDIELKDEKRLEKLEKGLPAKESKLYKDAMKSFRDEKRKVSHMFNKQPTVTQVENRIKSWTKKVQAQKVTMKNKDDNKTVALGTSKINYMDPRISVAWAKRNEVPIEKIFPQALRDKFPWAMSEAPDYRF